MNRCVSILITLLTLAWHGMALACPNCKGSIADSDAPTAANLPSGFNFSIYYMLVGVFCVMGLVGFVIVKGIRSSSGSQSPPPTVRNDVPATRR